MDSTYRLNGVEIFATGTHNGDPYSVADIDAMIEAFGKLDYKPPLKAGHSEDKPGMPALGWVENLRRVGDKLVADFAEMPKIVYDYIKDKRYNTVSSEIYWNLKRGENLFSRALKAVALLGAEIPAVAGLKPLHDMFHADATFKNASDMALEYNLHDLMLRVEQAINAKPNGSQTSSTDTEDQVSDTKKLEELQTALAAAEKKAADTEKQYSELKATADANAEQLKQLNEAIKSKGGLDAIIAGLDKDATSQKLAQLANAVEAQKTAAAAEKLARENAVKEAEELRKTLASAQEELMKHSLGQLAARVKVPAFRPAVQAFAQLAQKHPETKVYSEKPGEQVDAIKMVEQLVKLLNESAGKLFSTSSQHTVDDKDAEEDPGAEVDRRVKSFKAKNPESKLSYSEIMTQVVFAEDPALKDAYAKR